VAPPYAFVETAPTRRVHIMDQNPSSEALEQNHDPLRLPKREKRQVGVKVNKSLNPIRDVEAQAYKAGLDLEELSLRNLVGFWGEELRTGDFTRISSGSLRLLKDAGVVAHSKPPYYMRGHALIVTEYGIRLLSAR
jgi:hypothetical protein